MKQYQSGYIVDDLFDIFEKKSSKQGAFKELTRWVSHFQVNSKSKFEEKKSSLSIFYCRFNKLVAKRTSN
jgi:hypothetical protein